MFRFFERVSNILFVIRKWCLKIFELNRHISGSTKNNPSKIPTHEAVCTVSLIKSNLSFNSNMSNSDQHPPLNEREYGMERDLPDPSRSICPQDIFEP